MGGVVEASVCGVLAAAVVVACDAAVVEVGCRVPAPAFEWPEDVEDAALVTGTPGVDRTPLPAAGDVPAGVDGVA